jgi:N-succinyldiaminopimelate aminotransferase
MNPDLNLLHPYPFEKLAALKAQVKAPDDLTDIILSIGEPKHQPPQFVLNALVENLNKLSIYPTTKGTQDLRIAIADWLGRRFKLNAGSLNAERHVLPVNGTREALFAFVQVMVDRSKKNPLVLSPNPFYQIYEGAAILSGAKPYFLNCTEENNFIPDFDQVPAEVWRDTQVLFICSPGNPTGAVMSVNQLKKLIALADEYDFVIASDECYSELYFNEANPPAGLLQACAELKRDDFSRCVVFHSLSKRSNLPGLRSGFVAGDAVIIEKFLLYRTYHGCAMSVPIQIASKIAWQDEQHVIDNRRAYAEKFDAVLNVLSGTLNIEKPDASFYLWPKTPIKSELFAQQLFAQQKVTLLPGSYLAREANGRNPGEDYVRMALVATLAECVEAAERIKAFVKTL